MTGPTDGLILDALRGGRTFETGGMEARDHESYEWTLEMRSARDEARRPAALKVVDVQYGKPYIVRRGA